MADATFTGGRNVAPSGNPSELSRRQMFTGVACATLAIGAVVPAPALAEKAMAKHPVVQRAEASRARRNAEFWKAHAEYRRIMVEFEADDDRGRVESWYSIIEAAEEKMLMIAVTSVSAVRAKLMVTDDPSTYPLPGEAKTLMQMVLFDLERISMLEMSGVAYAGEMV